LGGRWAPVRRLERERERETASWERVRFGKWGEILESEYEMSTHPRLQRLFFIFFYIKKRKKMCHVGQEPDSSRTLDARIALLLSHSNSKEIKGD
jgi:hypothetical protein